MVRGREGNREVSLVSTVGVGFVAGFGFVAKLRIERLEDKMLLIKAAASVKLLLGFDIPINDGQPSANLPFHKTCSTNFLLDARNYALPV